LGDAVNKHECQLTNFSTFSQIYAQKYSALKFEYEQKILILKKFIADHNQQHEAYFKKLKTENQNLFAHIIQLTRKVKISTEKLKRKKPRLTDEDSGTPSFPPLPKDIDAYILVLIVNSVNRSLCCKILFN